MNLLKSTFLFVFIAILFSCDTSSGRLTPDYVGVDPQLASYINEYIDLAKTHGIKFNNKVTVGFKNINHGAVIGICNWGYGFREIDVDIQYWQNVTEIQRTLVIFHELSHCYCYRQHDYYVLNGRHNNYIADWDKAVNDKDNQDGFFSDRCPISIMFPQVLESNCFVRHYQEYMDELFRGCEPW